MADSARDSLSRLAQIDAQINRLREQRKAVVARERIKDRKERTRRLIQYGAIAESFFDFHGSPEEFKLWLEASVKVTVPFDATDPQVLEREIQRWMSYIRDNFKKGGYAYEKGIARIKDLGAYERFRDEIEAIIAAAGKKK